MAKKIIFLLLVSGLLLARSTGAWACAVCWGGDTGPTADAYNWSILFLMAAPYTVMGSIAAWLFYTYRRLAAKREESASVEPLVQLTWSSEESGR